MPAWSGTFWGRMFVRWILPAVANWHSDNMTASGQCPLWFASLSHSWIRVTLYDRCKPLWCIQCYFTNFRLITTKRLHRLFEVHWLISFIYRILYLKHLLVFNFTIIAITCFIFPVRLPDFRKESMTNVLQYERHYSQCPTQFCFSRGSMAN